MFSDGDSYLFQMEEFRMKMGNTLPNMPKPESSGRNEFGSVRELVDYLVEDGGKDASKKSWYMYLVLSLFYL